ncbi:MAG: FAD-dependent oxidoreductase [Oscillospiraceae bacterium]|nr:FAD-dependent oxidoreductase [Oscillospiraceae bacterium]MBR3556901.1 FAD-dependent oxidoreductase [Oscillospiraceae bacterium]
MIQISESARMLPVRRTCDVLVAGGGIAGIAAALAAARGGKKVLLLEREFALGGMATLGLVTIYLPLCDGAGHQLVYGIGEELLKLSIAHGAEANYPSAWLDGNDPDARAKQRYLTQFNPHLFAMRAEQLLLNAGVELLFGTIACSVRMEEGCITHVVVENKSGRSAIQVGSVIDATGDADICALAGAPTALHEGGNGLAGWYYYQKGSQVRLKMFGLADVVPPKAQDKPLRPDPNTNYQAAMVGSLSRAFRFSGVDGAELSDSVVRVHQKMYEDIMQNHAEDETYLPVTMSTIPLVRMSRRLCGAYTLDDSEERVSFPDSIGMTGDWRKRGPAYELPYRTLFCPEIPNLLAAGRDISVTDRMWDITRVIPGCAVTGEAAGTAAALGTDFPALNVGFLQQTLKKNGVRLHLDEVLPER